MTKKNQISASAYQAHFLITITVLALLVGCGGPATPLTINEEMARTFLKHKQKCEQYVLNTKDKYSTDDRAYELARLLYIDAHTTTNSWLATVIREVANGRSETDREQMSKEIAYSNGRFLRFVEQPADTMWLHEDLPTKSDLGTVFKIIGDIIDAVPTQDKPSTEENIQLLESLKFRAWNEI